MLASGIYPWLGFPSLMCPDVAVDKMAPGDVPQVVGLLNERYRGSHEFIEYDANNFASYVQADEAQVFILKGGGVKGVATLVRSGWGSKIDLFAVESGPLSGRYRNILLGAVEKAASVDQLYTLLEEGDPSIGEWKASGYAEDGGWTQMVASLHGELPLPPVKCPAKLRTMKPSDLERIVHLANSSFGFERLSMDCFDAWKEEDPAFGTDWVFVAECGGVPVSILVSKTDTEYSRYFRAKRGYLGPAATLPQYRNKGFATALTVMAMNSLWKRGINDVNLYTSIRNAASIRLLNKLGFRKSCTYLQLSKTFKS